MPKEASKDALLDEALLLSSIHVTTKKEHLGHFREPFVQIFANFRELPQWVRDHKEEFSGQARGCLSYCSPL